MPLSRAQYLSRVLLARRAAHWRVRARAELLAVLAEREADARKAVGEQRAFEEIDFVLGRGAFEEFMPVYETVRARYAGTRAERLPPPRRRGGFGQEVILYLNCRAVLAVVEALRAPEAKP